MGSRYTVATLVGIDKVRFRAPPKASDTISVEAQITTMGETRKPDSGLISHLAQCRNQRGDPIEDRSGKFAQEGGKRWKEQWPKNQAG